MPSGQEGFNRLDEFHTIIPEGIEQVYPRFAISWRNKWMIKQSDYVVVYITHSFGGATQFANFAAKKGKNVINIADINARQQNDANYIY